MRKVRPTRRARRFVARLHRSRNLVLALTLALAAVSAAGLTRLHFSADYRAFFDRDDPQRSELQRLNETFGRDDNLLIVIEPRNGNMFTPARLRLLAEITERASRLPYLPAE